MPEDEQNVTPKAAYAPAGKLRENWIGRHRTQLLIGGPLLLVLAAALIYLFTGRYMSTDDAYIQAARVEISANVPGQVVEIAVRDNQPVRSGDVLFKLDDRPYAIAVKDAEAQLAQARLQVLALKATYLQRQADLRAAQETLSYQQREYTRQQKLAASGISSQAQLDTAANAFANAKAGAAASNQQIANVLANLGGNAELPVEEHPNVQAAQAQLERARLNLSYTVIRASLDGIATKVEQLQPGDYINAGAPVFSLMSNSDIWVEANFKEDQLTYMRPGQQATFRLDAYPHARFTGTVQSASPGTGSSFSLLPPENATGNWVKIVQRLPVRIAIDDNPDQVPLGAGLSADVTVDTGHRRSLLFWRE